jgi:hypothetical protein
MQGAVRKQKSGYEWMRVGSADARFTTAVAIVSGSATIYLAFRVYREIPDTAWHAADFLALYFVAAVLYFNLGVWAHEQLHCLAFRGGIHEERAHIFFVRKYFLFLHGYYRVIGAIGYRIMRRALLGPLILVLGLLVVGWLGSLVLPGWWLPIMVTLAVVSLTDMVHDLYWLLQIRSIGERGRYWDRGSELEVVWKA